MPAHIGCSNCWGAPCFLLPAAGVPEVGGQTRRGAPAAGHQPDAQPALLPQLRADLVRLHAARGRPEQGALLRAPARPHPRAGPALQLGRLRRGLRLPARLPDEPEGQVLRVVSRAPSRAPCAVGREGSTRMDYRMAPAWPPAWPPDWRRELDRLCICS